MESFILVSLLWFSGDTRFFVLFNPAHFSSILPVFILCAVGKRVNYGHKECALGFVCEECVCVVIKSTLYDIRHFVPVLESSCSFSVSVDKRRQQLLFLFDWYAHGLNWLIMLEKELHFRVQTYWYSDQMTLHFCGWNYSTFCSDTCEVRIFLMRGVA